MQVMRTAAPFQGSEAYRNGGLHCCKQLLTHLRLRASYSDDLPSSVGDMALPTRYSTRMDRDATCSQTGVEPR